MMMPESKESMEGFAIDERSIRWMQWADTHGISRKQMASRYGVSEKTIYRILAAQRANSAIMGEA